MKNQKGITLVALIITIIVMLILAGVSISLVVGENGVLTQAQNAGTETKEAEAVQAVQLAFSDLMMQYYGNTSKGDEVYTGAKLEAAIAANGVTASETAAAVLDGAKLKAGTGSVKVNGITVNFTLTANGTGFKATDIKVAE